MNIWAELGISPTKNVREIKKAYAAKTKLVHPEEHPEEFQKLHEAYRLALEFAEMDASDNNKSIRQYDIKQSDDIVKENFESEYDFDKVIRDYENQIKAKAFDVTNETIKQLEVLYDSKSFVSREDYLELFNSCNVQQIKDFPEFSDSLYDFLKSHFISDSLGYAVYKAFCIDHLLSNDNYSLIYEKISNMVFPQYDAYEKLKDKEKRDRKYNILIAVSATVGVIGGAFCLYMAYKSGQLDEIINSFKGLIV
ncbi:MAG: J domain-containing protein [Eubacterium sp.]|nr:J domain-containing protein [Eubacterium sp.]MDE6155055.1 J domain-containing protein [Eubacterium sp.]MDE6767531.1 J domain-containing protein [Eubacterium sp.]